MGVTTFKNEEEYFEDIRLKWESSGLLDDVDEGIQVRMSIALELVAQDFLNEIYSEKNKPKNKKKKNSKLVFTIIIKILQETHSLLPEASFVGGCLMSDELKEVYEKIVELLNSSPKRIKKSTQDKLCDSISKEVITKLKR